MKPYIVKFILIFSLILFSCDKIKIEDRSNQHLRINIVDEVQGLDPRKARDVNSIAFMKMIYEGLTRISRDGKIELALAKNLTVSADLKTYTFELKDSYWTDGSKITSYDFASSWKKVLSKDFVASMCYKLYVIQGAKDLKEGKVVGDVGIYTPNSSTLIVKLSQPCRCFLELLSMPIFFPVAAHLDNNSINWQENERLYIGNGPFKIKRWKHQDSIELEKNNLYWDSSSVKLSNVSLYIVSPETELNMFETGKIDWAGSPYSTLPIDAISHLINLKAFVKQPFLGTSIIRINLDWCRDNFHSDENSLLFRKALAYSINRISISQHVIHESLEEAGGFLPSSFREFNYFHYIDNEKLILDFLKLGFTGPVKICFVNNDRNCLVMQALQRQWEEKLHIKVELEPLERKVYFHKLFSGKYQLALGSWIAEVNDGINFLEIFKYRNNGMNNTFWENTEYIDLLNKADICMDLKERYKLLQKAHAILMDEMPIIPIFHLNMCFLKHEKLMNYVISSTGSVDFRWAYFEE